MNFQEFAGLKRSIEPKITKFNNVQSKDPSLSFKETLINLKEASSLSSSSFLFRKKLELQSQFRSGAHFSYNVKYWLVLLLYTTGFNVTKEVFMLDFPPRCLFCIHHLQRRFLSFFAKKLIGTFPKWKCIVHFIRHNHNTLSDTTNHLSAGNSFFMISHCVSLMNFFCMNFSWFLK